MVNYLSLKKIVDLNKERLCCSDNAEKIFGVDIRYGSMFGIFTNIGASKTEIGIDIAFNFVKNDLQDHYVLYNYYNSDFSTVNNRFLSRTGYFDGNYAIENIHISNTPTIEDIESHVVLIESNHLERHDSKFKILIVIDFIQNMALYFKNQYFINNNQIIDAKDIINSTLIRFKNFISNKNNISVLLMSNIARDVIFRLVKANKSINDFDYVSSFKELSDAIFLLDYGYCGYYKDKYDRISLDCNCSGNVDEKIEKFFELLPFINIDLIEKVQYKPDVQNRRYVLI